MGKIVEMSGEVGMEDSRGTLMIEIEMYGLLVVMGARRREKIGNYIVYQGGMSALGWGSLGTGNGEGVLVVAYVKLGGSISGLWLVEVYGEYQGEKGKLGTIGAGSIAMGGEIYEEVVGSRGTVAEIVVIGTVVVVLRAETRGVREVLGESSSLMGTGVIVAGTMGVRSEGVTGMLSSGIYGWLVGVEMLIGQGKKGRGAEKLGYMILGGWLGNGLVVGKVEWVMEVIGKSSGVIEWLQVGMMMVWYGVIWSGQIGKDQGRKERSPEESYTGSVGVGSLLSGLVVAVVQGRM
jgi:hypothetical protein